MIVITGATGQLGRLVIDALLKQLPSAQLAAAVRNPQKATDLTARGIEVRYADYDRPETLSPAFAGADKLLLISANEVGRRVPQHRAVIDAAKQAKVGQLLYTSILHADTSPLPLAAEHKETERLIRLSGLPSILLRNGWYTENYLAGIQSVLQHGALLGSAGNGRIASAARADYAEAAAAALLRNDEAGRIYELAGDEAYTLSELAQEIGRQTGKSIVYRDLPEAEYKAVLLGAGLPEPFAALIAESDVGASKGGLFDDSRQLSALIGRPTTPLAELVRRALAG